MHNSSSGWGIEEVLDCCLDEIIFSGASVSECLAKYPQYAAELEPLLEVAGCSCRAAQVSPDEGFKIRARCEFAEAVNALAEKKKRHWFEVFPVWTRALAGVLVAVIIGGSGLFAAAGSSLPGQTLYGLKLAGEEVRMGFTFSRDAKLENSADRVNRRVSEIGALVSAGRYEDIDTARSEMSAELAKIATQAAKEVWETALPPSHTEEGDDILAYIMQTETALYDHVPQMFAVLPGDSVLLAVLKEKGLAGYLNLADCLDNAPDNKAPLEDVSFISAGLSYSA